MIGTINVSTLGLDYIEVWLAQLLEETRWITRFDTESCIAVLERTCPDFRGLHVNLYDLLLPHNRRPTHERPEPRRTPR